MRPGPDLYGFPWEIVICAGIVGAFTVLLFLYRSYQSVSVHITYRYEMHERLNKSNLELNQEIENLEKELEEEKSKQSENDNLLLQEAEGWGERFSELNEQTKMFESSKADIEEVLKNKESQVKLNACLKTLETERDQMYSKLSDENKAKGELTERIENLQSQQASLQSENERFEGEVQKLQQKLKVMTELYQENEMKLHRKLTVEERERLQKEEKLSKVDEKINHAAEELNTSDFCPSPKLTARAAERHLNDIKKENAHNRQKLTETEFKLDLLEKDPYALDVPVRPFGREHSPYGPSPMGRPSSETRAFLSPPTLLEGPLRLSPMLPGGGGGRGSRGPTAMYDAGNERGELSSDRLTDPHRPPSDTGSLSPPWDRERRIILPPPGEPYTDPVPPPRRQERFFPNPPNTGRLSGPAELRTYNVQPFDKTGRNCFHGTIKWRIAVSFHPYLMPSKSHVCDSSARLKPLNLQQKLCYSVFSYSCD
uniref:CTAGE family member 5 n=1 Tax=Strix occidentalis caurina TaxID=311401 RepID=A0A8D0FVL2_STROC